MQDERLGGQKAFVASRNVMRSVSSSFASLFDFRDEIMDVNNSLLLYSKGFDTLWLGKGHYKLFINKNNLNDLAKSGGA
jgi:hypothetical protein